MPRWDAVVVGSGPNGLAAAAWLATHDRSVLVLEAAAEAGGGTRTVEATLPGWRHDHCSAVHPLGISSPVFNALPLAEHGLRWVHPEVAMAHPLDDGTAGAILRGADASAAGMGVDRRRWRRLVGSRAEHWPVWRDAWLGFGRQLREPARLAAGGPPLALPATALGRLAFRGEQARAALAGFAAHAVLPLSRPLTGGIGVLFCAAGEAVGMPFAAGGSQAIADALIGVIRAHGGEVVTGERVRAVADLPPARDVLLDLDPPQAAAILGDELTPRRRRVLLRWRWGAGAFKLDLALDGPVPWRAEAARLAGTVHVGGRLEEVAAAEREVAEGRHPDRPFVLVAQPSVCDPTRAPGAGHVLWAYCHVPNGSDVDMTERILGQIERFAPGFRDRILACVATGPAALEADNATYVGGDFAGGYTGGRQMFLRPTADVVHPWRLAPGRWLCSQATPPGSGVHGMSGYWAAEAVLRADRRRST